MQSSTPVTIRTFRRCFSCLICCLLSCRLFRLLSLSLPRFIHSFFFLLLLSFPFVSLQTNKIWRIFVLPYCYSFLVFFLHSLFFSKLYILQRSLSSRTPKVVSMFFFYKIKYLRSLWNENLSIFMQVVLRFLSSLLLIKLK